MAARYPSQGFELYPHPHWLVDAKSAFSEDDDSSVPDEKALNPTSPTVSSAPSVSRKASVVKCEDAYYPADNMWHEGLHTGGAPQLRHHPNLNPNNPHINATHAYMRVDPSYAAAYTHPHGWPTSNGSGTSTPTPLFMSPGYGAIGFTPINQPDHAGVAMSPQSSQGGWGSTTSSESTEPRSRTMRSPSQRAVSPMSVMRPDGIRKKNARFEIPRDRNLHNIDSLILASTDESERKELKQQKRLLRNRQAALDSRQRKKTHTEKLEQEKKIWADEKQGLEDHLQRAQEAFQAEAMQLRQQYHDYIREVEYQRDEAIRTKTIETQELRRQVNALKEMVRDLDLERQRHRTVHQYSSTTESNQGHQSNFTPDFTSFDNLGLDDTWDDEFSLIGQDDFKMETSPNHHQNIPQQSTPKPSAASKAVIDASSKSDLPFSWNAFYMCLLFGAFIASKSRPDSSITSSIPALSEDYRAEAGNVLKAVLSSTSESGPTFGGLFPSHPNTHNPPPASSSHLEHLHTTLTSPSRVQNLASTFSLSAASYNHVNHPEGLDDDPFYDDDDDKPTRLQSAFENIQEQQAEVNRALKSGERSLLWDRVPEKVLRDFREMVGEMQ